MTQSSHRGRERSRGTACRRAISAASAAASPGGARPVWRRWNSRSKPSTGPHDGRPSPNGTSTTTRCADVIRGRRSSSRARTSSYVSRPPLPGPKIDRLPRWRGSAGRSIARKAASIARMRRHRCEPVPRSAPRPGAGEGPQPRRRSERLVDARRLGEAIGDHVQRGRVVQQADVAAGHLDVLAVRRLLVDARVPRHDAVAARVDRRRRDGQRLVHPLQHLRRDLVDARAR